MPIEWEMPSRHLILCHPLLLLPPIPPTIRVFSNESALHMRWPKYWSFSFSISPSNEHPGLISLRMDLLNLLAVQGTLKSLLQHHSSEASICWHSDFFTVQLSHPYMTTGKTITLTRRTFVGKVMSLLFNVLSRLVITFLPRSKCLLISRLQSPSSVILEPQKIRSDTDSTVSPSICHEVMRPDSMILVFWMLSFKQTFALSSFTFMKRLFSSSSLSAIRVVLGCSNAKLDPCFLAKLCPVASSRGLTLQVSDFAAGTRGTSLVVWIKHSGPQWLCPVVVGRTGAGQLTGPCVALSPAACQWRERTKSGCSDSGPSSALWVPEAIRWVLGALFWKLMRAPGAGPMLSPAAQAPCPVSLWWLYSGVHSWKPWGYHRRRHICGGLFMCWAPSQSLVYVISFNPKVLWCRHLLFFPF